MLKRIALVSCLLIVAASAGGQTLLVLPFENNSGNSALEWMGTGLAELSAERLPGDGRVVIPREEWLAALERLGLPANGRFTRATMIKLGEETDADFVVFGSFATENGNLSVTAQVLRRDPAALSAPMGASGSIAEVMRLNARLVWQILRSVDPVFPLSETAFVEGQAVLRLDAFEQFIRGMLDARDDQRLRFFREAARLEPGWGDPAFALGLAYFAQRDWATALIWLSRVPPAHSRGVEAEFYSGVCHLYRNDAVRAASSLAAALEHGEFPEVLNNLGVARLRQGQTREALAARQRATELDPEETDYWFNLGLGTLRAAQDAGTTGRDFGARGFREVLRREPQDAEARACLIAALERAGRTTEAETERDTSPVTLPTVPSAGPALTALRITARMESPVRLAAANWRGARPDSGRAAAAGRGRADSAQAQRNIIAGRRALAAGDLEAAERAFSEGVLLAQGDAGVYADGQMGLAEVYGRRGSIEQAIRALRLALWSREDAAVRISLARCYLKLNRTAEARTELRTALRMNPSPPLKEEAEKLLESLETRPPASGGAGPGEKQ